MRYMLLLLPFLYNAALAQQKESIVSISCYVNPELYIQAGVIARVSDKAGNVSCNGRYVSISNKSRNTFYYKINNRWVVVKPQGRAVVLVGSTDNTSSKSPSILKLSVKYKLDTSGSMSAKLRTITQMNVKTDVKAHELEGDVLKTQEKGSDKSSDETLAKTDKPSAAATAKPSEATTTKTPTKKKAVAKAKPRAPSTQNRPGSDAKRKVRNGNLASANTVGLRVDFGTGPTGVGTNIKHKFNRSVSLDAAILFFEGDLIGVGAQVEQSFPVKRSPGLNWYIGIGPQVFLGNENNAIALVPVTGLEYNIPRSPLNFSFDWRPSFYLSSGTDTEAGRFGLSLRVAF